MSSLLSRMLDILRSTECWSIWLMSSLQMSLRYFSPLSGQLANFQPDQARIIALNANMFLKLDGGIVISIKANCIDSTANPEVVFAQEVQKMKSEGIKPKEQITLEPYERDHCIVRGEYKRVKQ